LQKTDACNRPTRSRHARRKVVGDKVAGCCDDGNGGSRPLQGLHSRNSNNDDDVHLKAHKFSREFIQAIFAALPKPILNENVLAVYVPQIA
jgi:hypothetical protein